MRELVLKEDLAIGKKCLKETGHHPFYEYYDLFIPKGTTLKLSGCSIVVCLKNENDTTTTAVIASYHEGANGNRSWTKSYGEYIYRLFFKYKS